MQCVHVAISMYHQLQAALYGQQPLAKLETGWNVGSELAAPTQVWECSEESAGGVHGGSRGISASSSRYAHDDSRSVCRAGQAVKMACRCCTAHDQAHI